MTIKAGIVLYGSANSGKTTTLQKLIKDLLNGSNYTVQGNTPVLNGNDIQCCFEDISSKKKIAICTGGDTKWQIEQNLNYCKKIQADIFVMPARSYDRENGSRRTLINYASKNGIYLIWLWKSYCYTDNNRNSFTFTQANLIDDLQLNEVSILKNYLNKLSLSC